MKTLESLHDKICIRFYLISFSFFFHSLCSGFCIIYLVTSRWCLRRCVAAVYCSSSWESNILQLCGEYVECAKGVMVMSGDLEFLRSIKKEGKKKGAITDVRST